MHTCAELTHTPTTESELLTATINNDFDFGEEYTLPPSTPPDPVYYSMFRTRLSSPHICTGFLKFLLSLHTSPQPLRSLSPISPLSGTSSSSTPTAPFDNRLKGQVRYFTIKGLVHLKKLLLIMSSPPCHPRCPCLSFFSRKEI